MFGKLAGMFVEITAKDDPFNKAMDRVHSRLTTANVAVGAFTGNILAMFAKAAASAAVGLFDKTIQSASTLNETTSKVKTVFGDAADSVLKLGDDMAKAYGTPKQEILDATAILGLFAKGAGQSAQGASEFSQSMVKLASDAASFYNVPFAEAIQKIQSGLSGESEPLRAFGVFLNEDAVATQALSMGLAKTKDQLTDGNKVMARAALITKGMATASGDLDRTLDGTENQSRKFWGTLSNLGTEVGTVLLPIFDQFLQVGNSAASTLAASWEASKATFTGWADSVVGAFDVVKTMWRNLGDVFEIGRIKMAEGVANLLAILSTLPDNVAKIAGYIGKNWYQLIHDAIFATGISLQNFLKNITDAGSALGKWAMDPFGGFDFNGTPLLDGFKATADALPEMTRPAWVSYQDQIDAVGKNMADKEVARAAGLAAKAKAATAPAVNAAEAAAKKAEKFKSESLGASDFAAKLRAAQLEGVDNIPQQQLDVQKKGLEVAEKTLEATKAKTVAVFA